MVSLRNGLNFYILFGRASTAKGHSDYFAFLIFYFFSFSEYPCVLASEINAETVVLTQTFVCYSAAGLMLAELFCVHGLNSQHSSEACVKSRFDL